ncbi:hypothetical protein [Larkinella punicea]|uniref:Uncharacterized protein n=1 Tax=Larkinella punicea TaxID=2315727 RepID=A0A368JMT4_9BACT|nr:hypothetical protein [Larkinella punicea]RCR67883.1 hypothetical protein DUE52_19345 [Larkinella punicea]
METGENLKPQEIEVLITDIKNNIQVEHLVKNLKDSFPTLKINFDLSETKLPYPCGHTVLRIEGSQKLSEEIKSILIHSGFKCAILEDKVCN